MAILEQNVNTVMQHPGDVVVEDIILRSYNGFELSLKGLYTNVSIYENIYRNFVSGSIDLVESYNILKHFPVIGDETLLISFYTPVYPDSDFSATKKVRMKFHVFDVSVSTRTSSPGSNAVRLEFVSKPAVFDSRRRISKSYMDMKLSDMVKSIWEEYLENDSSNQNENGDALPNSALEIEDDKLVFVEPTIGDQSIIVPYWTPFYAINWMANRSRSTQNPYRCDYLFYQNTSGYNFRALGSLKNRRAVATITNVSHGFRQLETGVRDIKKEMRNAIEVSLEDYCNTLLQQKMGLFSSRSLSVDAIRKKWKTTIFDYGNYFNQQGDALNAYPLVSLAKSTHMRNAGGLFKHYATTSNLREKRPMDFEPEDVSLMRQSLFQQINSINFSLTLHGDTNIQLGDVIYFNATSQEVTREIEGMDDDYIKGRYLITAIKHTITDKQHVMKMIISKDSFEVPVPDEKERLIQFLDSGIAGVMT